MFAACQISNRTQLMAMMMGLLLMGRMCLSQGRTWTADNGNGTYTNPLFYDEFADPDILRVGQDFYLTGSSMHMNPGLPVLHSRDLVNWDFASYAMDQLDLGPAYKLEDGKNIYGQGIWAPSFRYHNGTFYIFANVNGQTTQIFQSKSPKGPWKHSAMKRSFHDLSVLFDDDEKVYLVWGYGDIRIAQLDATLSDIVPGTDRLLIARPAGMGEGHHLYKINGRYYLVDAWYSGVMRLPVARADNLNGPWEVNRDISVGEQFGQILGWRLSGFRPPLTTRPPYTIVPPDPSAIGRMAIHQGGIVDTPSGQWWGVSMGEQNALGRAVSLSPITWKDGWPYFGLPGNLGRTPRTWTKPDTGAKEKPHAPYQRSDDFSGHTLQPVWQWNHVPAKDHWSLSERPGFLRLHALPASSLWDARDSLTQRAIGPRSTPTLQMETSGMATGDVAGLGLLIQPDAWIGVEKDNDGLVLVQHDGQTMEDQRLPVHATRVWLRVECEFQSQLARFSYSADGHSFHDVGEPFRMVGVGFTFQGVRYALFNFHKGGGADGYADFDSFHLDEPKPHGLTAPIPYGKTIILRSEKGGIDFSYSDSLHTTPGAGTPLRVVNMGLGRVALHAPSGFLSISEDGTASLLQGQPTTAQTFQWIETFTGELTLMSLQTHRYLQVDPSGNITATSGGPEPNETYDRFHWK